MSRLLRVKKPFEDIGQEEPREAEEREESRQEQEQGQQVQGHEVHERQSQGQEEQKGKGQFSKGGGNDDEENNSDGDAVQEAQSSGKECREASSSGGEDKEGGVSNSNGVYGSAESNSEDYEDSEDEDEGSGNGEEGEEGSEANSTEGEGSGEESESSEGGESEAQEASSGEEHDGSDGNNEHGEEDDEQSAGYNYNTQQVVDVTQGNRINVINARYMQTEFYRFLESFAEDKMRVYVPDGFDEWNVKRLMLRQYERKPLTAYKASRIRQSVVLILDNSGSMDWWAENLRALASLALVRGDVEIFIAPNGHIEARLTRSGIENVEHEKVMRQLIGRRIIYVGDYDGGDTPVELSWRNDVVWIAPEQRYRRFKSHDWMHYDESDFRGVFIRVYTIEELMDALKKVTRMYKLWIDYHENDEFQDDGWG